MELSGSKKKKESGLREGKRIDRASQGAATLVLPCLGREGKRIDRASQGAETLVLPCLEILGVGSSSLYRAWGAQLPVRQSSAAFSQLGILCFSNLQFV